MTTKRSGLQITGLLALTCEADDALEVNDAVHLVADYTVHKADGTRPILGFVSVANKGRISNVLGTSVNNSVVPGDVTVEARGLMVRTLVAGAPVAAGLEVAIGSDNKVYDTSGSGTPTDEVQSVTEGGSGLTSFTLTFSGQTTTSLLAAATALQVQAALEALSNVGVGNVTVSGSAGGPFTVTFLNELADSNVAQMTATPTGGSGTVTVATATAGSATSKTIIGIALTDADAAGDDLDVLVK